MKRPILRWALIAAAGIAAAPAGTAQVVPLARCHAAYPCAIPFDIQSRPDPLIAGQYGTPGHTAFSLRIPVAPMSAPRIDTGRPEDSRAVDAAVRAFGRRPTAAKEKAAQEEPEGPR